MKTIRAAKYNWSKHYLHKNYVRRNILSLETILALASVVVLIGFTRFEDESGSIKGQQNALCWRDLNKRTSRLQLKYQIPS
jgi:hypothetical protein